MPLKARFSPSLSLSQRETRRALLGSLARTRERDSQRRGQRVSLSLEEWEGLRFLRDEEGFLDEVTVPRGAPIALPRDEHLIRYSLVTEVVSSPIQAEDGSDDSHRSRGSSERRPRLDTRLNHSQTPTEYSQSLCPEASTWLTTTILFRCVPS